MNTDGITVSMSKGIKANFKLGEHLIEYWGSAYSGKEVLKVDGELIAESRNFKTKSVHEFNIDGKSCQLCLRVRPFFKFSAVISLECEGELVQRFQLTYGNTRKVAWYFRYLDILAFFILGWVFMAEVISLNELILLAGAILIFSEIVFKNHGWIIEEQKPCN